MIHGLYWLTTYDASPQIKRDMNRQPLKTIYDAACTLHEALQASAAVLYLSKSKGPSSKQGCSSSTCCSTLKTHCPFSTSGHSLECGDQVCCLPISLCWHKHSLSHSKQLFQ